MVQFLGHHIPQTFTPSDFFGVYVKERVFAKMVEDIEELSRVGEVIASITATMLRNIN